MLERTLERSHALISTRISIMNSRAVLAEKSRCLKCSEGRKEVHQTLFLFLTSNESTSINFNPTQIVFVPCGHRSLCQVCASSILTCPVCEMAITSKVTSYDT